jgi:glucosamine--fructose-6-phosphate aminotransferase (isomerizing)
MCGIFGVIGCADPIKKTVAGLSALEYRGYDSAGVAYLQNNKIKTIKSVGNIAKLKQKIAKVFDGGIDGKVAIGHTRWATNGVVSEENSHPHLSADGTVAVVHNGIIENYNACVLYLSQYGIKLKTTVDTEVISNMLCLFYHRNNNIQYAIRETMKLLSGDYAICVMFNDRGDTLATAKHGNMPLHLGFGKKEIFISSDVLAFPQICERTVTLDSGEFAVVSEKQAQYYNQTGEITKTAVTAAGTAAAVGKNGFTTYMEKEINEIPQVIERIIKHYKDSDEIKQKITVLKNYITGCSSVHIAACGTSYHAGLIIGAQIEKYLRLRTKVTIASEFSADAIIGENEFAVIISQSGETADTISAMRVLQKYGVPIMTLCNVETSTAARESAVCFPLLCGAEIAVASTKAFVSSVLIGMILINEIAGNTNADFTKLPDAARSLINSADSDILPHCPAGFDKIFFIGKGDDYFLALESALKVKEVTYTHCEGLPAGELKHGTLSLVDSKTLAVAYFSDDARTNAKMNNAVAEISARGGNVAELFKNEESDTHNADKCGTDGGNKNGRAVFQCPVDFVIKIIPAQIFALKLSQRLGINPDQPRNLAKSVTVE